MVLFHFAAFANWLLIANATKVGYGNAQRHRKTMNKFGKVSNQKLRPLWYGNQVRSLSPSLDLENNKGLDLGILTGLEYPPEANKKGMSARRRGQNDLYPCDGLYGCDYFACDKERFEKEGNCNFSKFDLTSKTGKVTGCTYTFCYGYSETDDNYDVCYEIVSDLTCSGNGVLISYFRQDLACTLYESVCTTTITGTFTESSDDPWQTLVAFGVDAGQCSISDSSEETCDFVHPFAIECPNFVINPNECVLDGTFGWGPSYCSNPRQVPGVTGQEVCTDAATAPPRSAAPAMGASFTSIPWIPGGILWALFLIVS